MQGDKECRFFLMNSFFFSWQPQKPLTGRNCDSWDGSAIQLERRLKWNLEEHSSARVVELGK